MRHRMSQFMEILTANTLGWPMPVRLQPEQAMYVYAEIKRQIKNSFEEYHAANVIEVDWDNIKSCLSVLKEHYSESKLMWKTVYLMFEHFEKYKHVELLPMIADLLYFVIFDTFYIRHIIGTNIELIRPDRSRFPSLLNERYTRDEHNCIWKLLKVPYRNDFTNVVPKEMNIVWLAANNMDSHRLLPLLLRHGVMYMPPSSHYTEWIYCNNVLRSICCFIERPFDGFDLKIGLLSQTIKNKLGAKDPTTERRILTVFRAMGIVQKKMSKSTPFNIKLEPDAKSNFTDRFRMIFDTIPEPIVTLQEVRNILEKLFLPTANNRETVDIYCKWFERLMPESTAPFRPRSLKHLCRCRVREILRQEGSFPYSVYDLEIPESLKKDILLDHWYCSESFKKDNNELYLLDTTIANPGPSSKYQSMSRSSEHVTPMLNMTENYEREVHSNTHSNAEL